jgi:hypothetical protein
LVISLLLRREIFDRIKAILTRNKRIFVSVEKFWLVEFGSNLGSIGKGVAVLETGNIFAGD